MKSRAEAGDGSSGRRGEVKREAAETRSPEDGKNTHQDRRVPWLSKDDVDS